MSEPSAAVTTAALGYALDVAALRQQAIASNIANAQVQGYRPLQVDFEARMAQLRTALGAPDATAAVRTAARGLRIELRDAGPAAGMQLDSEVADMAHNSAVYQALIKGLNRHFSIESMAAGDGRR